MNDKIDGDDIEWSGVDLSNGESFTYFALYSDTPIRPKSLNLLVWIKYLIRKWRGERELIAYWSIKDE